MKHPNTRSLFDYWRSVRIGNKAPYRSDIDPQNFKRSLENIFLLQRMDASHHVFRLAGTGLCHRYGREFRDQNFLSLWDKSDHRAMRALIEQSTLTGQASYAGYTGETVDGRPADFEVLMLPLRGENGTKDRLIGIAQPLQDTRHLGGQKIVRHRLKSVFMLNDQALTYKPVVADALLKGKLPPYLRLVHSTTEVA